MPTILTHAIVPLAVSAAIGRRHIPSGIAFAGAILAMLPDADVIGFRFDIAYAAPWGHRGATHSLVFAGICTALALALLSSARKPERTLFLYGSMASHGILDMLTNGGLGVAIFWPFDLTRHFLPWTPIRVSPIGRNFFTGSGLATLMSEVRYVWLPCASIAVAGIAVRRVVGTPRRV